ncbi:MAG: SpoVR family protein [Pseudobdellovibrionaceae bacterium]
MDNISNTPSYKDKIEQLLSHYVDGDQVFINAHKAKDFDYPLLRKEEFADDPYLPDSWLALVAEVQGIIAKDMMGLDVYSPRIEIIRADQMLDMYTTVGLPHSYRHWSFGKARIREEKKFDQNKHLAYEIVINSDPCIAYCMDTNSPVMQMLVISHACYGHNAVFKNNYLFQEFTNADTIIGHIKSMRDFIEECEEKYGWKTVSDFLDFCHAMDTIDVPDTKKVKRLTSKQLKAREIERRNAISEAPTDLFNSKAEEEGKTDKKRAFAFSGEKNILMYMAEHDERFSGWQRNIMKMRSELSQYFKPQRMTQLLNEGFATYVHNKIMTEMYDMGLMDYGMFMEFKNSNDGVTYQPSAVRKVKGPDGKEVEKLVGASMNPYALGYAIYCDIERICNNPTEEDRRWFKNFAGSGDWLAMTKHAMENSSDETFVAQYLSPTVMRKFAMFSLEGMEDNDYYEITAIHNEDGFRQIRDQLAENYRYSGRVPDVSIHNYQDFDRCLILRHRIQDGKLLDEQETTMVLQHMHKQRGYPVVIESVDEDGEVIETLTSIPDYDYTEFSSAHDELRFDI